MKKVSSIGSLVKKIYRNYSGELLILLQVRGFTDLRPSFLEVLLFICEHEGPTIKEVGTGCGLKKQTMTSHLNELERRGYIERRMNTQDKREQNIFLTEYGLKFKLNLFECIHEIEKKYTDLIGDLELNRVELILKNFHSKLLLRPGLFEQVSSLD
jgi:DNA-binding MarR family transcriptional regulator